MCFLTQEFSTYFGHRQPPPFFKENLLTSRIWVVNTELDQRLKFFVLRTLKNL